MSLATRCPSCGTIFRVVQDQLKVSEGWVRCGRCGDVFSALEALFDLERESPPPLRPNGDEDDERGSGPVVIRDPPPRDSARAAPSGVAAFRMPSAEAPAVPPPAAAPPVSTPRPAPVATPAAVDVDTGFADAQFPSDLPLDIEVDDGSDSRLDIEPAPATPGTALVPTGPGALVETPSFLTAAQREARWQRPRVRASLTVLAGLLGVILVGQLAIGWRASLAAHWPGTVPWLSAACAALGCTLEPPRRIGDLVVEASGLSPLPGQQAYRLSLTLRNRGPATLAMPFVEVSLSDPAGALLSRRGLAASAFHVAPPPGAADPVLAPPGPTLASGADTQLELLLTLPGARVAGYTVELFYP
jgi:predicted Zn finger-like uncharacterized protein